MRKVETLFGQQLKRQEAPVSDTHEVTAGATVGVPTWDEIVENHSDRVFRLAYRLTGNRPDAQGWPTYECMFRE